MFKIKCSYCTNIILLFMWSYDIFICIIKLLITYIVQRSLNQLCTMLANKSAEKTLLLISHIRRYSIMILCLIIILVFFLPVYVQSCPNFRLFMGRIVTRSFLMVITIFVVSI